MNREKLGDFCEKLLIVCCYSITPLILLGIFVVVMTTVFLGGLMTDINDAEGLTQMVVGYSIPMIVVLIAIPLAFEIKKRDRTSADLGIKLNKSKVSICGLFILFVLACVIATRFIIANDNVSEGIGIIISFIVVAVTEEFYTRGVLYFEIKNLWGDTAAFFLSSLIFAFLFHSNSEFLVNLVFRLPIALLLGFVRKKMGDVYTSSLLHFIYNVGINF